MPTMLDESPHNHYAFRTVAACGVGIGTGFPERFEAGRVQLGGLQSALELVTNE